MTEAETVSWNNLVTILLLVNLVCIVAVWVIPNGHCSQTCECKKANRSHK